MDATERRFLFREIDRNIHVSIHLARLRSETILAKDATRRTRVWSTHDGTVSTNTGPAEGDFSATPAFRTSHKHRTRRGSKRTEHPAEAGNAPFAGAPRHDPSLDLRLRLPRHVGIRPVPELHVGHEVLRCLIPRRARNIAAHQVQLVPMLVIRVARRVRDVERLDAQKARCLDDLPLAQCLSAAARPSSVSPFS